MIIDEILDRKYENENGYDAYDAHDFYMYCMQESSIFGGIGDAITRAMDFGTNENVQNALCDYIVEQNYNRKICDYVRSMNWIENGKHKLVYDKERGGCYIVERTA